MTSVVLWRGRQARCYIAAAITTPDTTTTILEQIATPVDFTGWVKDVTITGSSGEVEQILTMGEDANNFQNANLEQKPWSNVEVSGTMVFSGVDTDTGFISQMTGTGTTTNTDWKQFQAGGSAAANLRAAKCIVLTLGGAYGILNGALSGGETTITMVSTTGFSYAGTLAISTDIDITYTGKTSTTFTGCSGVGAHGDSSVVIQHNTPEVELALNNAYITKAGEIKATADGHVEMSFTAKCLPEDYFEIFENA